MTLLADVVQASKDVTDTSSRSKKIERLAELLRKLDPHEVPIAVGMLSGVPRQGRIGIGWSTIYGLQLEPATEPSITIDELDKAITEVQKTTGSGSAGKRKQILTQLLERATEPEQDIVRRLFTGELRQGALAGLMIDAVAKAAEVPGTLARRAFMLSGDLTETADIALTQGAKGLKEVGFQIFRPVLPMLASTAADAATAIQGFELASVEWKLDGIRIQVHKDDGDVRIYTRNLNDITHALPGIVETVLALPVRKGVFDGEALWMAFGGPASFQETMQRIDNHLEGDASRHPEEGDASRDPEEGDASRDPEGAPEGIVTHFFDILHVDGEDLLDAPLKERNWRLEAVAPDLKIPGMFTSDPDEAQRVLDESLAAGHEGVVVKDADSLYIAGRRGKAWRKVKPVQTYDLVVLGAEWGHGRRQGWLSNLHLGARDPKTNEFVMVGKCFKGLTDELLEWQTKELLAREKERNPIAVFVKPELVVEIALDGVQRSTRYPGGVALRFARVKRYRSDKNPEGADTIGDLQKLLRYGSSEDG